MTVDHGVAHELLRSDDFRVTAIGGGLPGRLQWIVDKTDTGLLHPLRPPSLLSVEPPDHTRYRKIVSSVFTPRAVASLRDRVEQHRDCTARRARGRLRTSSTSWTATARSFRSPSSATSSACPTNDRPRILHFGELGAPSLDIGLSWRQYLQVQQGIVGFNSWLADHLQQLRRNPGDDLMSQIIAASDEGAQLNNDELQALAGLVLAAGFETTVNLLGNGIRMLLDAPGQLETLAARPELWPNAVEEILRLDSPVQMSARIACKDVDVAGTRVRQRRVGDHPPGRAPTATRRSSPTRIASTSNATTRASICPSPAAGTSASVRRWPARKGRSGCGRSSSAIPTPGWPEPAAGATPGCCAAGRRFLSRLGTSHRQYGCDVDFRAALIDETEAFGELIRTADPATPIPTCPDWTLKQLFRHVGRGNRWAAQIVADEREEPLDPREVRDGKPPDDPDGADRLAQRRRPPHPRLSGRRRRPYSGLDVSSDLGPRNGGSAAACTKQQCTAPTRRSRSGRTIS